MRRTPAARAVEARTQQSKLGVAPDQPDRCLGALGGHDDRMLRRHGPPLCRSVCRTAPRKAAICDAVPTRAVCEVLPAYAAGEQISSAEETQTRDLCECLVGISRPRARHEVDIDPVAEAHPHVAEPRSAKLPT